MKKILTIFTFLTILFNLNARVAAIPSEESSERDTLRVREVSEIMESIQIPYVLPGYSTLTGPWIFTGYRHLPKRLFNFETPSADNSVWKYYESREDKYPEFSNYVDVPDSVDVEPEMPLYASDQLTILSDDPVPDWLHRMIAYNRVAEVIKYNTMIVHPETIQYASWQLPLPPTLHEDDISFTSYIKSLYVPNVDEGKAIIPELHQDRTHWLHTLNGGVQFSQAYVSANWYQGGNNHLALLINFLWNVDLNTVYHPNLLFQSSLSYKLGLNSTPNDQFHKYSISEDLFQYNLKTGFKAFKDWFYSFNLQFKTQILNNYEQDSQIRKASFLSPGDLNLGIGMTYNHTNKRNNFKVSASIAPLSYNLKTCIDPNIDHLQFNIQPDRKSVSEFGSSAEINTEWAIRSNIIMRNRLFAFTDYSYFQGDLETTISFNFNRWLSTQIYAHLRYDSSSDLSGGSKWRHWMLKEILSFGLSYTFTTVPTTK